LQRIFAAKVVAKDICCKKIIVAEHIVAKKSCRRGYLLWKKVVAEDICERAKVIAKKKLLQRRFHIAWKKYLEIHAVNYLRDVSHNLDYFYLFPVEERDLLERKD